MDYLEKSRLLLCCVIATVAIGITWAATAEDHARLHLDLFERYRKFVRPVKDQNDVLQVNISFFIIMIHDLDLKNQVLTTNAWLRISWYDQFLKWDSSEYGNLKEVLVSKSEVWTPDLLVENTAYGYKELGIEEMKINVDSHGLLIWEPGIVMKTICEVSIAKYPFDNQHCAIRVMSWMHTNKMMKVHVEKDTVDLTGYYPNGEWDVTNTTVKDYSPDDGSYNSGEVLPGAEAILQLRRKPVFYILSTILPISMLSLLNLLVFLLPASTGEKMTLAVTVLLSFTVFMSVVNEIMPKTSNSVSILAVYLTFLLCMSGVSVASTVWVLYLHHKDFAVRWQHLSDESTYVRVGQTVSGSLTKNNSNHSNLKKVNNADNSGSPHVHKRLLPVRDNDTDPEVDEDFDVTDASCLGQKSCFKCPTGCGCGGEDYSKTRIANKVDKILFWSVAILTTIATTTMLLLLTAS